MRDIGGLIWVIVVIIGVISSVVKNAKKAAAQREAARPRMQQQPAPPRPAPSLQQGPPPQIAAMQPMAIFPPVEAPVAPPVAPPVRRAKAAPQPMPMHPAPQRVAVEGAGSPIRGMFGRGSIVRAIVAAEVLGPPKSLQERSIWSPPHSEPSI